MDSGALNDLEDFMRDLDANQEVPSIRGFAYSLGYRHRGKSVLFYDDPLGALCEVAGDIKAIDSSAMSATAVISTTSVDREGDIVLPSGFDLTGYRLNPVVLLNHAPQELENLVAVNRDPRTMELTVRIEQDRVIATNFFSQTNPRAELAFAMVDERVLNAKSIGFLPKQIVPRPEPAQPGSDQPARRGVIFAAIDLLEESWISGPQANIGAVQLALETGRLGQAKVPDDCRPWLETVAGPRRAWSPGMEFLNPEAMAAPVESPASQAQSEQQIVLDKDVIETIALDAAAEVVRLLDAMRHGLTGTTDMAREHVHRVLVDIEGNGATLCDGSGHVHRVRAFAVSDAADHRHVLDRAALRPMCRMIHDHDIRSQLDGVQQQLDHVRDEVEATAKAGRVLSQANYDRIEEVASVIEDVLEHDKIGRADRTALRAAARQLREVLASASANTVDDAKDIFDALTEAHANAQSDPLESLYSGKTE